MKEFIITEERLQDYENNLPEYITVNGCKCETRITMAEIHARPYHSAAGETVLVQCATCFLKGTRACMYHGYPYDTIPKSCEYKVGVNAQFALDNLAGTFIIKGLRE